MKATPVSCCSAHANVCKYAVRTDFRVADKFSPTDKPTTIESVNHVDCIHLHTQSKRLSRHTFQHHLRMVRLVDLFAYLYLDFAL